ncbi:MAG TPA: superoxide dismutase family protein [Anaeromyxobacteraceae bacterium]|nr:superoxide dismutase family protein [Anaeromyxobacteraceae bacterium]
MTTRLALSMLALSLPILARAAPAATAQIKNAAGETVAQATVEPAPGGATLTVRASKLPPGTHGFHVHAVGKCEGPDFKSAGGHFNPAGKQHGLENPAGPHAGDMPNLVVGADGTGTATVKLTGVSLDGGPDSLFHEGGTSLVVHAGPDDMKTDPAGNSGARIACGVIERAH